MEGPLVRELREIGEGSRDFPVSTARRHHYVPAFVLAKFATPRGDRRAFMAQLDTRTGRPGKTTPHDSCFEKDLYAQRTDEGRDNTLESFFSIVERHSAPALARLTANPLGGPRNAFVLPRLPVCPQPRCSRATRGDGRSIGTGDARRPC
jgi:uncharacterized protein DUF4238